MQWNSYLSFVEKIISSRRYFHDKNTEEFFENLLITANKRIAMISAGQHLWRAQSGYRKDPLYDIDGKVIDYNAIPYSQERMKPNPEKAADGRVNPKGIPCLYLASDEKTAIAEVRPWVGVYVTVAQFTTIRTLKILDCSNGEIDPMNVTVNDLDKLFKLRLLEPDEAIRTVWRWIDKGFSGPVDRDGNNLDYVPTQVIAEFFKTNGFDGIKYSSLFNGGVNFALFDINSANQIDEGRVFQITNTNISYKQIWPFFRL
jgi:hypothetical protein